MSLIAVLAMSCDEAEKTKSDICGDGIVEGQEICDGTAFAPGVTAYCADGTKAATALLKCTSECLPDVSEACAVRSICGNGIIEVGEECDGEPLVTASCESPDLSKLTCEHCRIVDRGVCPKVEKAECGNGIVEGGEYCDGTNVPQAARVCPENMAINVNPLFKCMPSCNLVDISQACHFTSDLLCGNGQIDEWEDCDGTQFDESLLSKIQCGAHQHIDVSKAVCNACTLDVSKVCVDDPYDGLIISELVPGISDNTLSGIAVEIANMGNKAADLSSCKLTLFSESGIEKQYAFSELGITSIGGRKTAVLCSQPSGANLFGNVCTATLSQDNIIRYLGTSRLLGITCDGESQNEIVDLANMNSFISGAQRGATDYVRLCSARPVTESKDALMGEGWTVLGDTADAPSYNLGAHCNGTDIDQNSIYCKYSVNRQTLTTRDQSVSLALEIGIAGITDETPQTDITKRMTIEFVSGKVKNGKVTEQVNHYVKPTADTEWTSTNGIDRYVGTLRNWDMYEGFWSDETGDYVLDARITFDNGETFTYCGKHGVLSDYSVYNADERNLLNVSYDDGEGAKCGDGKISASEVCDGEQYLENALDCSTEGEIILKPSDITCYCNWLSTDRACGKPITTCGNDRLDSGEVCDGAHISDAAKVCNKGEVSVAEPKWTCSDTCAYVDQSEACEKACGNGKVDTNVTGVNAEICDGDIIPDEAKVCPKGMVAKDDAVWTCNDTCSGIDQTQACEASCGNNKLDSSMGEICDGHLYSETPQSVCKERTTYDESRKRCTSKCSLDQAACVPDLPLVIDEYAVYRDEKGTMKAMAVAINLYGNKPLSDYAYMTGKENRIPQKCTLSILDKDGRALTASYSTGAGYVYASSMYGFDAIKPGSIIDTETSEIELKPCEPLVICSLPFDNEADYKKYMEIFDNRCDATVALATSSTALHGDYFITRRNEIARMQISCTGEYIDFLDFTGLNKALSEGKIHGKLKSTDLRPWSGSESVDINARMDLDDTFDMSTFGKPVCTPAAE